MIDAESVHKTEPVSKVIRQFLILQQRFDRIAGLLYGKHCLVADPVGSKQAVTRCTECFGILVKNAHSLFDLSAEAVIKTGKAGFIFIKIDVIFADKGSDQEKRSTRIQKASADR